MPAQPVGQAPLEALQNSECAVEEGRNALTALHHHDHADIRKVGDRILPAIQQTGNTKIIREVKDVSFKEANKRLACQVGDITC